MLFNTRLNQDKNTRPNLYMITKECGEEIYVLANSLDSVAFSVDYKKISSASLNSPRDIIKINPVKNIGGQDAI